MKSEKDFTDGQTVIYSEPVSKRTFAGRVDYSYGDEKPGFIRVQEVFSETSDEGNTFYVPVECIQPMTKKIPYHYVVRTYSGHTAKNTLWKVLSRRIKDIRDAESWLEFCKSEEPNSKHEFFIITKYERVKTE